MFPSQAESVLQSALSPGEDLTALPLHLTQSPVLLSL